MRIGFEPHHEAFRRDVRAFFANEYPARVVEVLASGRQPTKQDHQTSEQALSAKGWLAVNWPRECGGPGWDLTQKYIFDEELERAGALNVVPMGLIYVGPVIYTFGTEEQKAQHLPGILNSTVFWAQGYSEPESGSDLASLQFKAERQGDNYVLNGTKIWTSQAQHADWIFCLVRTSKEAKKQLGITFLLIDMKTPGIEVHPIITIDGKHSLNRVTFADVVVPVANRIGEEGKGWTYANFLLGHERTSYAHVAGKRRYLQAQRDWLAEVADPAARASLASRLAELEVRLDCLEMTVLRSLAGAESEGSAGDQASIIKIAATELEQDISENALAFIGTPGVPWHAHSSVAQPPAGSNEALTSWAKRFARYYGARAESIYGGTNEIQHNIIAKKVLGLT